MIFLISQPGKPPTMVGQRLSRWLLLWVVGRGHDHSKESHKGRCRKVSWGGIPGVAYEEESLWTFSAKGFSKPGTGPNSTPPPQSFWEYGRYYCISKAKDIVLPMFCVSVGVCGYQEVVSTTLCISWLILHVVAIGCCIATGEH